MVEIINSFDDVVQKLKELALTEKQAFDILSEFHQQVWEIAERAIKEGDKGHKRAIHQIVELCRDIQ